MAGMGVGLASQVSASAGAQTLGALQNPAQDASAGSLPVRPPAVVTSPPVLQHVDAHVHVNQVGYLPGEAKRAVIPAEGPIPGNAFAIIDDDVTPQIRYQGPLVESETPGRYDRFGRHFIADFSAFDRPGRYRVRLSDGKLSTPFTLAKGIYSRLAPLMIQYFDVQACGLPRSALRGACHLDDGIAYGGPRNGLPMDTSGGWHDAGDYLKFVETTSFVTALLLFTHLHFERAFPQKTPRGRLPQLLDQARVGLEWLLKMHPTPDEFYYQVGDESDHESWRLPEEDNLIANKDWKPRRVYYGVGANLAGRTAAALAMASRLYAPYDPRFALRCLKAGQTAYRLGLQHREVLSTTPYSFYPEQTWADDMEWGAISLYEATGRKGYLEQALEFARQAQSAHAVTSVYNTHALAHYTLYPHASDKLRDRLLEYLRADAEMIRRQAANPYGLGTPYLWGTAEAATGAALTCLLYAILSREKGYLDVARWQRDFVLGCNPFGLCCLIGAGTRYPLFPHHQIANIRNVELSGALVGGPADYRSVQDENIALAAADFDTQNPGPPVAEEIPGEVGVYHDAVQDYVTNEPANDYTAKFLLLTAFYVVPA